MFSLQGRRKMTSSSLHQAQRILILRLGAIGDALRVLPALARIRRTRPRAFIGWAVEHWVHPVLAANSAVDRFHILDRRLVKAGGIAALQELRRHAAEIRDCGYDVVLDFHGRFKSGVISRMSGVSARVGFAAGDSTEANHLFNNVHVRLEDRWENRVLRFLHLLEPLGMDTGFDPDDMGIVLDRESLEAARSWYLEAGKPPLALYPGCSAVRSGERWPLDKWQSLLRELDQRSVESVVFWGPAEQDLAAAVAAAGPNRCRLAPATSLPEMMAMLGCFRAFLGSDTAAMHMSWMQKVATGVFVGPKPPRTVAPLPPVSSRILRVESHYREGLGRRKQPVEIISEVPVPDALEAVDYLLQGD